MDPQTQASFIPKKPLLQSTQASHGSSGVLWFVALLIFIAAVISGGAAFAYQQYLGGAITSASASLARAQAAYDSSVINDITRLDSRLTQAQSLLQSHVAPSAVFTFLEATTLSNIRFTNFEYDLSPDGSATLALSGEALDFPSVALQSDAFNQNHSLKDVLFSDINVDPTTGRIVFKVSAVIDPSLLLYSTELSKQSNAALGTPGGTPSANTAPATPTGSTTSSQTVAAPSVSSSNQSGAGGAQPFGATP